MRIVIIRASLTLESYAALVLGSETSYSLEVATIWKSTTFATLTRAKPIFVLFPQSTKTVS